MTSGSHGIPSAVHNCSVCDSKNAEITFLRELVKLFMEEKKISHQVFVPTGVDENGKVFRMDEKNKSEDVEVIEDIDVINEVLGH